MHFNFALDYSISRVQVKQEGLQLNGTHQLLVYTDVVNMLGGSVHTIKKNTKALVIESQETGLEVKVMVMSADQNAGRSRNIKIINNFLKG